MEEKSREFVEKGAEVYAKAYTTSLAHHVTSDIDYDLKNGG